MAVAFDTAAAADTGTGSSTTLQVSPTLAGSDRYLLAFALQKSNGDQVSGINATKSSSATAMDFEAVAERSNTTAVVYSMVAPDSGAIDVDYTLTNARRFVGVVQAANGVDQTTPAGTFASDTGNDATPTTIVSSATDELVFDGVCKHRNSSSEGITVGAGQTERAKDETTHSTATNNVIGAGSTEVGAASTTMSWSIGGSTSRAWAIVAGPVKPAAAGLSIPVAMNSYRQRHQSVV